MKDVFYGLLFAMGIVIGCDTSSQDRDSKQISTERETQIWTCSMHPQIRQDKPGKCPLCAMDLIPLKTSGTPDAIVHPDDIQLSEEAVALANVQTTIVRRGAPVKEMRLYGIIKPDERLLYSLVSHVGGRIETLSVNYAGEKIRKGQVVATIYSPDLLNAQQELLEARNLELSQPALLAAAREKLRLWKLTDKQIEEIERTGKASPTIDRTADVEGTVIAKRVEQGDYVGQGGVLFDLADLSSVWALFDAYESDLLYLKTGDKVEYTLPILPGKVFSGEISWIDPILDQTTRTGKIRVETPNPDLKLKPGMYANAVVKSSLKDNGNEIIIPKTAVLWTGKRSIVYVKKSETNIPTFQLREIELGASLGNEYVVLSGIGDGEEIVTNGVFTIDASAQLEGKPSMMNRETPRPSTEEEGRSRRVNEAAANEHAALTVQGLCGMCKERIEKAAKSVDGVSLAQWNGETKQLRLNFDSAVTSLDAISQVIAEGGHDTEKHKADDKIYDALPECCKYRNESASFQ
ncbi:MAG: efflux RND transporter periplasmic adaptor subunit [Planctomycetaceae bacterium]|jgi:Cu(I)/Ag(I) efflux system membrane fusion protein|nr:efflux RND transporter periplasmic adaptor subunit [Planctomycetaceae bacterium]